MGGLEQGAPGHSEYAPFDKVLRALHHEARELVAEDALDLVRLLDLDADPHRVNGWLDEDAFILVS